MRSRVPHKVAARLAAVLAAGALALGAGLVQAPSVQATTKVDIQNVAFHDWATSTAFGAGNFSGTTVSGGQLTLDHPTATQVYTDPFGTSHAPTTYDTGTWTSPRVEPGFNLSELVASWDGSTPNGSWLEVDMRGTTDTGATSKWYVMGRWSADDPAAGGAIHRTSVPGQGDATGTVSVDTFVAASGHSPSDWQLRVTLNRQQGTTATPSVSLVGAMASQVAVPKKLPASPLGGAEGMTLNVPTYSQETHRGQYPQWDNGGEAWCSPTSTAMVVSYWNTGPTATDMAWVDPAYDDPQVDYAARNTYDYSYDGAGNWPFNTAYAARYGLESYVTRLRSLTEAEQFIKAGIPVVVSVSFKKSELTGAGYGTGGHLMVIVGFTGNGDVVVNDPASHLIPSDAQVRTVYDRQEFENTWIPHSGGIAYIIHPPSVPAPPAPGQANWEQ